MTEHCGNSEEDKLWLENLSRTAPGRQLHEHFTCVNYAMMNQYRGECPLQQVAQYRRTFVQSFAENDRFCGLPRPTPRFIAVCNLSGYRGILYSDRATMVRLLCLVGPESSERVIQNVECVMKYAAHKSCTVLCCLSMPWQSGVHATCWEVRTLERRADGSVRDGARCYAYGQEEVRTVATTVDTDMGDADVMRAQIDAMRIHFASSNLDIKLEKGDASNDGALGDDERAKKLKGVVAAVQADRARILGELAAMRDDHREEVAAKDKGCEHRIATIVNKAKVATDLSEKKVSELKSHVATLEMQNAALEKKNAALTRQKATQDLEFDRERTQLTSKSKLAEMSAKTATEKLSAFNKSTERERSSVVSAHAKVVENIEKRLQQAQLHARKLEQQLEDHAGTVERLDCVMEQMRAENEAMSYDNAALKKKVVGLRCALAVASRKHCGYLAEATAFSEGMKKSHLTVQNMLAAAEGVAGAAEDALAASQKELAAAQKELAQTKAAQKRELAEVRRQRYKPVSAVAMAPAPSTPAPAAPAPAPLTPATATPTPPASAAGPQAAPASPPAPTAAKPQLPPLPAEVPKCAPMSTHISPVSETTPSPAPTDESAPTDVAAAETTSASLTPVFKRSVERLECLAPLQSGNKSWNVTTEPSSFLCSRQMVERGDQTAPLQTKAHLELAALSEKYIKIQDDLKALQSSKAVSEEARATAEYELEQFRHQHAPVSWQQQPAAVQIDLGSDPNGDACVEALVAQAQLSMRAVVELARQSQQHKQAADSLWNEMQQSSRREQHAQQWASPVSGYYEGTNFNQHAPRQQQQQHYPPPFHNGPRQRSSFNR